MALNTIHNALSDMLQDMDIAEHYQGTVHEVNDTLSFATISAKIDPTKAVVISIELTNKVEVKILEHKHMSPMFAQMVLENLAIQINPDSYD